MLDAVTGRMCDDPGFAVHAAWLFVLLQVLPAILVAWSVHWGSGDRSRSAQIAWAVVWTACSVAVVARWAICGTESTWDGLRVRMLLETRSIPWSSVVSFTPVRNGVGGIWMHAVVAQEKSKWTVRTFHLPHPFAEPGGEDEAVAALNRACGTTAPEPERRERAGEYWGKSAAVAWLALCGCSAPVAVALAAVVLRRRWLVPVAVALADVALVLMLLHARLGRGPGPALVALGIAASGVVPLVFWLRGAHRRRSGQDA